VLWPAYREIYCDIVEARHPGEYARQVRRVLNRFGRYRDLEEAELNTITSLDLDGYVTQRIAEKWRGSPLSPRTINNEIKVLITAFDRAGPPTADRRGRKNFGYMTRPPSCDFLPEKRTNPVELTREQQRRFVSVMSVAASPRPSVCDQKLFWKCVFLLVSVSPFRTTALLAIPRPADLLERLELLLPADLNKVDEDRTFAISQEIAERLDQLPSKPGEPLLPWHKPDGSAYSPSYFSAVVRLTQRRAGVSEDERVLVKNFRSTVGTQAAGRFGTAVAKQLLGHSAASNTINTNYIRRGTGAADRAAVEQLSSQAIELLTPDSPQLRIAR
jgi:integrase